MATNLLEHIRDHLVAHSIARKPGIAGTLPPLFLEPVDGAPAPGEPLGVENNDDLILTLMYSGGIPPQPLEGFFQKRTVDFWIRARTPPIAYAADLALRNELNDKLGWTLSTGLFIHQSILWRDLQPMGWEPVSVEEKDREVISFISSYLWETTLMP